MCFESQSALKPKANGKLLARIVSRFRWFPDRQHSIPYFPDNPLAWKMRGVSNSVDQRGFKAIGIAGGRSATLVTGLSDASGIRRKIRRNRLSCYAPPGLRMPACCTTSPTGHTNAGDSKSCWMKLQWQVTRNLRSNLSRIGDSRDCEKREIAGVSKEGGVIAPTSQLRPF